MRSMLVSYWCYRTTYCSNQGSSSPLEMGTIGCSHTLVRNYHSMLCKIPRVKISA